MKRAMKRLLSLALVFALMLQMSGGALAAVGDLLGNSSARNDAIYQQLSDLTGGTPDEARALLERLGLLDEKGNLDLTAEITMDGKTMTVDEVWALLDDSATDLTKIVNVDGTPVSLQDLKTMLQIEAELARIQETYFSGKTFGAEATESLNSLMRQIESVGISLYGEARVAPSAPYLEFSATSLSLDKSTPSKSFNITLKNGPLAKAGSFAVRLSLSGTDEGAVYKIKPTSGSEVTLGENTATTITVPANTSVWSATVTVSRGTLTQTEMSTAPHKSYLQVQNPNNIQLGANNATGITVPVTMICRNAYDWTPLTGGCSINLRPQNDDGNTRLSPDLYNKGNFDYNSNGSFLQIPLLPQADLANLTKNASDLDRKVANFAAALKNVDLKARGIQLEASAEVGITNFMSGANAAGGWDRRGCDFVDGTGKNQSRKYNLDSSQKLDPMRHLNLLARPMFYSSENQTAIPTESYTVSYEDQAPAAGQTPKTTLAAGDKVCFPIQMTSSIFSGGGSNRVAQPDTVPPYRASKPETENPVNWAEGLGDADKKAENISFWTTITLKTGKQENVSITLPALDSQPLSLLAPLSQKTDAYFENDHMASFGQSATWSATKQYTYAQMRDATGHTGTKNELYFYIRQSSVKVIDTQAPKLVSAVAPSGSYATGQTVPVVITFDEPVKCSGLRITANGKSISCSNSSVTGAACKSHVFEYPVQKVDSAALQVTSVSGVADVFGNQMAVNSESHSLNGVTLASCFMKDAAHSVAATKPSLEPTEAATGTTLTLTLDQTSGYKTKYTNYPTAAVDAPYFAKLVGGDGTLIPFKLKETNNVVSAVAATGALAFGPQQKSYTYQIMCHEQKNGSWDTSTLVNTGKTVTVTVKPMVFVNGLTITDASDKRELSLTDTHVPTLTKSFTGSPTYITGAWSSSDTDIATIDEKTGVVTLAGKKLGEVKFTFTADDGDLGLKDPESDAATKVKSANSETYTVTAGGEAGIVVPKGGNSIVALEKETAQVRWYGNLNQYLIPANTTHVTYTLEVFEGNLPADTDFTQKTPVYSAYKLPIGTNFQEIPVNTLTALSKNGDPAYTVRISAPHPNAAIAGNGIKLYTYAYIIVNPVPVKVKLTPPKSLYALDSASTASVSWNIENYKANTTTAKLTVERVDEKGSVTTVVDGKSIAASGNDSFTLAPVPQDELRALYVVTVAAKNESDAVFNTDSYQFYVYNSNSLDIEVDGKKTDTVTLSNRDKNMNDLPKATEDIMDLRGTLGLNAPIGINYDDYAWSALKDGIAWKSGDDTKVGVNFKQGSFYEDIKRFGYDRYLPETTMAIAGLGETTGTKITATHANTGMSTQIDVKVESLENKLYLFQATPMVKTTLTYTDGKGTEKKVDTNDKGTLALYEPEGIKGFVHFRAVDTNDNNALYLGTISAESLRSGEGNTLLFELYPLNSMTLRKVARTDLYLKNPDGTPYSGSVTVRGGVYKNGGYCQDAQLGINSAPLKDGKMAQEVNVDANGRLTIQMDVTQFWSKEKGETSGNDNILQSTDKLEYIFELTEISGSCPLLSYVDGVAPVELGSRTGEGVVTLETASQPGIVLARQRTLDKNGDVRNVRYRPDIIGANEVTPKGTDLESTVLLWGETEVTTKAYTVSVLDEFGFKPTAQKSETITYPFSSIPVVRNTLKLTPDSMTKSGWIEEGQPRGLKLQVLENGALQKDFPTDLKAADLSKAPKLQGETATNIMVDLTEGSGVGKPPVGSHDNKVVQGLMNRLAGDGESVSGPVDTSNFKMIISPGDDASTFKAFIWAGYNSLGLEDAEYDDHGLSVKPKLLEQDLTTGFGAEDASALAHGGKEAAKSGADLAKSGKSVSGGGDFGGQLEGYYEALIKFNFKTQQWEIFTLGGGFTAGFGGSFGKSINQMVGPIPITASFELGAAIQLDFKMASRYKVVGEGLEWSKDYQNKQYVTDFLTTLRINAYFEAFGGVGFDISIVALKFGVFGRLTVDNSNAFLSRTYLANANLHQQNGQALKLTGEVGIKFVLTVIGIIDYKATLASLGVEWSDTFNNWESIQSYWKNTGSGLENQLASLAAYGAQSGLSLVDASATLQSRDYLEDFTRTWGAPRTFFRSIDVDNGLTSLQTNAYPNARPQVTDDGQHLLYLTEQGSADLTSTRVYATEKGGNGKYPEGSQIPAPKDFPGYGDSDLRLAGRGDFAVATWISQNSDHKLEPEQEVTAHIQSVLTNATEIVASVNTGSGWTSTRITDNGTPDLAPVVAVGVDKAIVAWRSVYAGDAEKPMDFSTQDNVLYQIYDKTTGKWSDTKILYPGTSGVVKGIEAAVLPDGTAAVTYTLDRSGKGTPETYEVSCSIVNKNGEPGRTIMLTNDSYQDENPQVAAVDCGADGQRFVIGWYSVRDGNGDIRMAALNADGLPSASFPESLGQISSSTIVGNNFRFVAADKLENLSILWSVTSQEQATAGDQLLAVKFLPRNGKIGLSAPIDVATLPPNTNTDHFDAYVSNAAANEVKAVIQGTEYAPVNKNDSATYEAYSVTGRSDLILVPKAQTKLFTATETYQNKITLSGVWADYENLAVNSLLPVQFTVTNSGFETLNQVKITLGGAVKQFDVNLPPNESATLTLYHPTGTKIGNVNYSITPTFGSTPLPNPTTGTLHLDYPDTGIAEVQVLGEHDGKRDLRVTLYNAGAAKLTGSGRTLNVAFYDNSFLEGEPVTVNTNQNVITISDEQKMTLADNGALCVDATFDLDAYLTEKSLKENEEIPAAGMRLYAKVWVEDSSKKEVPEFHTGNNMGSVQLDSLLTRAGQSVTITVAQNVTGEGKTTADVTVRNNSLKPVQGSGNVTATLLDKNGAVLETQQSYQPKSRDANNGLITLDSEASVSVPFAFQQKGASVTVTYGELVLNDTTNAELATFSASGIPVRLTDFTADETDKTKFTAKASTAAGDTLIQAAAKDPGATVTVNGAPMADGGTPLHLSAGKNTITVEVTARDGTTKRTYVLAVERTTSDPSSGGGSSSVSYDITATAGVGGSIAPAGKTKVKKGDGKTYTITPDKGYVISDVLVDGVSVSKVSTYTFKKVEKSHTIEARFAPMDTQFMDVSKTDWFYEVVDFVVTHDLMKGTGENQFTPMGSASRAMIVTVLHRMEKTPDAKETMPFDDVAAGQWYTDAVMWAAACGVAQGIDGKFMPNADVTREQLAQFLYNFAKLKGYDLSKTNDLAEFKDAPTGWSREGMSWAVGSGIVGGRGDGTLDPHGKATRAELAAMLMRFIKTFASVAQ